ncbi:uncharacterized protein CELE_F22F7.11 [Caenorhabditis elegans]|uniref:Uncharacterized protein n=1 Tax=Caenorhabditis elegans TaxID=6239 RepID=U4PMR9_CAEEL|nr:Uncharacterized protein CELE_F22F7.11 [Caenorhabditis elegans]CDH93394.1 Uncharacterized protein CELE_F22F7.11 [Caenorhabditis elegans]|eukprot:NP_001294773.1 Uncharacterized protein CELE_F22F7.11 [Caenorhabditis elegans]
MTSEEPTRAPWSSREDQENQPPMPQSSPQEIRCKEKPGTQSETFGAGCRIIQSRTFAVIRVYLDRTRKCAIYTAHLYEIAELLCYSKPLIIGLQFWVTVALVEKAGQILAS